MSGKSSIPKEIWGYKFRFAAPSYLNASVRDSLGNILCGHPLDLYHPERRLHVPDEQYIQRDYPAASQIADRLRAWIVPAAAIFQRSLRSRVDCEWAVMAEGSRTQRRLFEPVL